MQTYTEKFVTDNKLQLTPEFHESLLKAKIFSKSDEDIKKCAQQIRDGKLVSFPTETVYGLGADATNETAIRSIYEAKGRPLTDPVIVHISNRKMVDNLIDHSDADIDLLNYLADNLWPGPITFIMKANLEYIPAVVTANTGYVGIRFPVNEFALKLIEYAGTPICAPSANKFAHISPTSSVHVFNDLFDKDISIIDGPNSIHGMESTVVKIVNNEKERALYVLRHGSVPTSKIRELIKSDIRFSATVQIHEKQVESSRCVTKNAEAPGQLLKHYCPKITTYLLTGNPEYKDCNKNPFEIDFSKTILVDFNKKLQSLGLADKVLKVFDLSDKGDVEEAMQNFYAYLREAELVESADTILIIGKEEFRQSIDKNREFFHALWDKMFRSASGQAVFFNRTEDNS